jgi:hypothetical protein
MDAKVKKENENQTSSYQATYSNMEIKNPRQNDGDFFVASEFIVLLFYLFMY